jgi:rhodanese-related sulfurtransferase
MEQQNSKNQKPVHEYIKWKRQMKKTNKKAEYNTIEPDEALNMIENKENFYLIDVRTEEEFNFGHLQKAINIPLNIISNLANQSFKSKDSRIVLYCKSGARSRLAATELTYLGYNQVYDLGGIISYPYELS